LEIRFLGLVVVVAFCFHWQVYLSVIT